MNLKDRQSDDTDVETQFGRFRIRGDNARRLLKVLFRYEEEPGEAVAERHRERRDETDRRHEEIPHVAALRPEKQAANQWGEHRVAATRPSRD